MSYMDFFITYMTEYSISHMTKMYKRNVSFHMICPICPYSQRKSMAKPTPVPNADVFALQWNIDFSIDILGENIMVKVYVMSIGDSGPYECSVLPLSNKLSLSPRPIVNYRLPVRKTNWCGS